MKTSIRFFCWVLVGVMFCVVSFGGCGGSSNLASVNTQDDTTSGDTSGRGDNWSEWDDLTFETNITGKWKITDTYMELGTGDYLYSELGITDFQLTAGGNTLTISTLDGRQAPNLMTDFEGYDDVRGKLTSKGIVVLSGGKYYLTGNDTYKQTVSAWTEDRQNYYTLQGRKASGSTKWDSLKFTNVYMYNEPGSVYNFTVTTFLTPIDSISVDDFEVLDPLELFSGNWKIVSSKLTAGTANDWGDAFDGSFFVEEESLNKYLKTKAGSSRVLFAPYNPDNPNQQISWSDTGVQSAKFAYFEDGTQLIAVTVPIITNAGVYTQDSSNSKLYSTPMFEQDNNSNTVRQTIEAFGSYPWSVVKVTHREYDPDTSELKYQVVTTLENISY